MNPNADYLGIVTLLRGLREQGLVSGSEAKKIAARLMVQLGADIIISRQIQVYEEVFLLNLQVKYSQIC